MPGEGVKQPSGVCHLVLPDGPHDVNAVVDFLQRGQLSLDTCPGTARGFVQRDHADCQLGLHTVHGNLRTARGTGMEASGPQDGVVLPGRWRLLVVRPPLRTLRA